MTRWRARIGGVGQFFPVGSNHQSGELQNAIARERDQTLPLWQRQTKPMTIRCPQHRIMPNLQRLPRDQDGAYRPEVLNDPNYQSDEPIDDD
jgi:hypothetical protein